jgi:predicted neutral ceramidase superfamily lipid hydrolase
MRRNQVSFFIKKDLKITKATMIIDSKKNNFKNKYKKQTRRNSGLFKKSLFEDFLEEKLRSSRNRLYEEKVN